MALLEVKPLTLMRGGAKDADKPTYQKVFLVRFDSKPADWDEVINAAGLPAKGDPVKPGDPRVLTEKTPAKLGDAITDFIVTCDYEVLSNEYQENPLLRKDIISGDFTSESRPYFTDFSDPPQRVLNSSFEPFDQLPENKVGIFNFCVHGNRESVPAAVWAGYLYPACAKNSNPVTIRGISFGAGVLLLLGIRFSQQTQNGVSFYDVEWNLGVSPEGWDQTYDDVGYSYVDLDEDTNYILRPIVKGTPPEPVKTPWPLMNGVALDNVDDDPDELTFVPQPEKDFSIFGWTAGA